MIPLGNLPSRFFILQFDKWTPDNIISSSVLILKQPLPAASEIYLYGTYQKVIHS
jgi:hypothetical protein